MRIKAFLALTAACGPALALTIVGTPAPPILTEQVTTIHASICDPSERDAYNSFFYSPSGVFAVTPADTMAVLNCPIVRPPPVGPGALSIWVDGTAGTSSYPAQCFLYSLDRATGKRTGGMASFSASGVFSRRLTLTAAQVPAFADASQWLTCWLPGGWNGGLFDYEPVQ